MSTFSDEAQRDRQVSRQRSGLRQELDDQEPRRLALHEQAESEGHPL